MPPPDDDMLFDAHRTHDMLPIRTKLETSNSIGGVFRLLTEIVFLVNSQDEVAPTFIDEPEVIANGLQGAAVAEQVSVFWENMREERTIVKLDETA